jgi:hypothetical protein
LDMGGIRHTDHRESLPPRTRRRVSGVCH